MHIISSSWKTHYIHFTEIHIIYSIQINILYPLHRNTHYILYSDKHTISSSQKYTLYTLFRYTFKYHVFAPMGRFQLESIYLYFPPNYMNKKKGYQWVVPHQESCQKFSYKTWGINISTTSQENIK